MNGIYDPQIYKLLKEILSELKLINQRIADAFVEGDYQDCPICLGSGVDATQGDHACLNCDGEGDIWVEEKWGTSAQEQDTDSDEPDATR